MESARGGGKGWGGGEGQEVGGTSEKVGGSRDKELKGLGEENDADGQVKWHLELTETFFLLLLSLYLCHRYPHIPLYNGDSDPMCGLYVMYIFESNMKEITMHSCKNILFSAQLFTFRPLYALTV